jgi:hypothetical protein
MVFQLGSRTFFANNGAAGGGNCRNIEQEPHGPCYDGQGRWLQAAACGNRPSK